MEVSSGCFKSFCLRNSHRTEFATGPMHEAIVWVESARSACRAVHSEPLRRC
jgi:hypothetical protein